MNIGSDALAVKINGEKWWHNDPDEQAWLETTDRDQVGIDLSAPQKNERGLDHHGYSLVLLPRRGDVIFHYRKKEQAITEYSVATGVVWNEEMVWAAHGAAARKKLVQPRIRLGWRHGLLGPFPLKNPVDLQSLRGAEPLVAEVRQELEKKYPDSSLYFPFALSKKRALRPTQFYMTKFPIALVHLFPTLTVALQEAAEGMAAEHAAGLNGGTFGTAYSFVNTEDGPRPRDPFVFDPSVLERGTTAHFVLQNALANWLIREQYTPLSPKSRDPKFDIAWRGLKKTFVAEIKSLTFENEEQQLRLGLGQVLRYQHLLKSRLSGNATIATLVIERAPSDPAWVDLCSSVGVLLIWPLEFLKIKLADS